MKKKINLEKGYKVLIYIMIILIGLSIVVPVLWTVVSSFKTPEEFFGNPWSLPQTIHIQNYIDAIKEANMDVYIKNSLFVTILALIINLLLSLPTSYVLSRYEFKGRNLIRNIFMLGLFINASYIVVPLLLIFLDIDAFLNINFSAIFDGSILIDNLVVLAFVYAGTSLPFTIYLLSGYFETISDSYEEAAELDGASRIQTMFRVMFPIARPAILTSILFNFLNFWNEYIIALTFLPSDDKRTIQIGLLNLMSSETAKANNGRLYAGMILAIIPVLILYIVFQRKIFEGMATGGSKE